MAIFGGQKESKEEKQERKTAEILERFGLNDIQNREDVESVRRIAQELAGTGLQEIGMTLGMNAKPQEALPVYYLRAIMEQNWIIIRQLDRLNKNMEK
ncbi:MAG: hypothetical protein Q4C03_05090 [bacterium]|nr:hypothetical protein [bacterium]